MSIEPIQGGNYDVGQVWKVRTPATTLPVTLAEFKEFARLDGDYEDTYLALLLEAVSDAAALYLNRSLITRTMVLSIDSWPTDRTWIELPEGPVISVTAVRILDEDGSVVETYSSDNYYLRLEGRKNYLHLRLTASTLMNSDREYGGIEIEYLAGYGTSPSNVPAGIRHGILAWAAICYETRVPPDGMAAPPAEVQKMLSAWRVWYV